MQGAPTREGFGSEGDTQGTSVRNNSFSIHVTKPQWMKCKSANLFMLGEFKLVNSNAVNASQTSLNKARTLEWGQFELASSNGSTLANSHWACSNCVSSG